MQKDEGGPMFHKNMETKQYELLGISILPDCAKRDTPALFTRVRNSVFALLAFIRRMIGSGFERLQREWVV